MLDGASLVDTLLLSGSLASSFTATLFSPLECVKTRLQVQDLPGWPRVYSGGLLATLSQIAREDGLLMLWTHGFAGFVGRDFLYSGLRIGLYDPLKQLIVGKDHVGDVPLPQKILAGLLTGGLAIAIAPRRRGGRRLFGNGCVGGGWRRTGTRRQVRIRVWTWMWR